MSDEFGWASFFQQFCSCFRFSPSYPKFTANRSLKSNANAFSLYNFQEQKREEKSL